MDKMITWDEPKRLANLDKHGFDFADLTINFFLAARVFQTKAGRYAATGLVDGRAVTVIFAPLGTQGVAIISMRTASSKERR